MRMVWFLSLLPKWNFRHIAQKESLVWIQKGTFGRNGWSGSGGVEKEHLEELDQVYSHHIPFSSTFFYQQFKRRTFPANISLFKVNNRNIKKRCEMCPKLTMKDVVPVFLLLTLNIFHIFFQCFCYWLWISKCYLGCCMGTDFLFFSLGSGGNIGEKWLKTNSWQKIVNFS